LENLQIDTIFKNYDEVLMHDSDMIFPQAFTQDDRDAFYRMKFRALSKMIANGQHKNDGFMRGGEELKNGGKDDEIDLTAIEQFVLTTN